MSENNNLIISEKRGILIHFGKKNKSDLINNFAQLLEEEKIEYYLLENNFDSKISQLIKLINPNNRIDPNLYLESKIDENILFFTGFSRDDVEKFLKTLRNPKYPRFVLKAVATKTNLDFTFSHLLKELRQDRIIISYVVNLRKGLNILQKKSKQIDDTFLKEKIEQEIISIENLLSDFDAKFQLELFEKKLSEIKNLIASIDKKLLD